jgi:hypothetical protein
MNDVQRDVARSARAAASLEGFRKRGRISAWRVEVAPTFVLCEVRSPDGQRSLVAEDTSPTRDVANQLWYVIDFLEGDAALGLVPPELLPPVYGTVFYGAPDLHHDVPSREMSPLL